MNESDKKRAPVILDGDTLTEVAPPRKRRGKTDFIQLHDLQSVRREMSNVYRDMRKGMIETSDGSRLTYVLVELRKILEVLQLEARLKQLEEKK